ncbi:MAG: PHP domain-containing protein [Anaerolineales bacterium]|nr:PHP domain-containing protein [Anaerolineales bacterium]
MKKFRADLHVHTVLSPCAEVEMIPPLIVQKALELNIDIIAITDHNASANVSAVQKAAQGTTLKVLPGMEVQSREDVHLLCLFENLNDLEGWQSAVDESMPDTINHAEFFGEQFIVDEQGEYIRTEPRLLLTSTRFSIDGIFERVNALGGLVIPAHVERTTYGLFPTLGLLSDQWPILGFEISRHTTPEQARMNFPSIGSYPLIQNGDVHRLDEFIGSTIFMIEEPTIKEIRKALKSEDHRKVFIEKMPDKLHP